MNEKHRQSLAFAREYRQLRDQWADAYESYDYPRSGKRLSDHLSSKLAKIGDRMRQIEAELGEVPRS